MKLFEQGGSPTFVGVVHLLPFPGSPQPSPGLTEVLERAEQDATHLAVGGIDAIVVENLGDAPFESHHVDPYTVAMMTRAVLRVRHAVPRVPVGVNVLRNDAVAALSVAAAAGAAFIRVNVHVGAMVTDQGLIQGRARDTLLLRRRLGADVRVVADVLVKHAVPLGAWSLESAARDTVARGLADVVVVTGSGTGQPTDPAEHARVKAAVPDTPVWVGSGLSPSTVEPLLPLDGAIVGTWLHEEGALSRPIDAGRVRRMRVALGR